MLKKKEKETTKLFKNSLKKTQNKSKQELKDRIQEKKYNRSNWKERI